MQQRARHVYTLYAESADHFPTRLEELGESRNEATSHFWSFSRHTRWANTSTTQTMPNSCNIAGSCWPIRPDRKLPRYVDAAKQNESPWRTLWEHQNEIDNGLTKWFRELASAGCCRSEKTVLGRAVALSQRAARLLAAFWLEEISRKAGSFPKLPDFILNERINRGGNGKKRSVVHIDENGNDAVRESLTAAGKAEGVDRTAVSRRPGRMTGWVDG